MNDLHQTSCTLNHTLRCGAVWADGGLDSALCGRGEAVAFDDLTTEEVLLDDLFQNVRVAGVIPHAFRIDDRDGALEADAQTVGAGALDDAVRSGEPDFLEAFLEELPRSEAGLEIATLGFAGSCAEEDVPLVGLEVEGGGGTLEFGRHDKRGA